MLARDEPRPALKRPPEKRAPRPDAVPWSKVHGWVGPKARGSQLDGARGEAFTFATNLMGIDERRARERERRKKDILEAAWRVAEREGWVSFSVEKAASEAELGRATIYSYFESLEALVLTMAEDALARLSGEIAAAPGLSEALDVPVRFAQKSESAFALLFPPAEDPRPAYSNEDLQKARRDARNLVGRLDRLASKSGASLPADAQSAAAFISGISMAGAMIPELRYNTPLRRRWQEYCLKLRSGEEPPRQREK